MHLALFIYIYSAKLHVFTPHKPAFSMLAVVILTLKRASSFTVAGRSIPAKGTVGGFPRTSNNKLIQDRPLVVKNGSTAQNDVSDGLQHLTGALT